MSDVIFPKVLREGPGESSSPSGRDVEPVPQDEEYDFEVEVYTDSRCEPCRMLDEALTEMQQEGVRVKVRKRSAADAAEQGMHGIPTFRMRTECGETDFHVGFSPDDGREMIHEMWDQVRCDRKKNDGA